MSETVKLPSGLVFRRFGEEWVWIDPRGGILPVACGPQEADVVISITDLFDALLAEKQRADQAEEDVRWLFDYGPGVPNYTSPPDYRKHLDEIRARHLKREDSND